MLTLFLTNLSKAMNAYLHLDAESANRLQKLQGKIITIELLPFHYVFQCAFTEAGVAIQQNETFEADTKISGTPLQMVGVMLTKDRRHQFFADDLTMTGNAEFGQQVVQLFDELEIDWEEQLAKFVGDVPAHQFGRLLKNVKNWLNTTGSSFTANVDDYVHEEKDWFPTRENVQDFFNDIDTIRMDVDRIEAKIHLLRSSLQHNEDKS